MLDLHDRGMSTFKFSTHTPYWYQADKLKQMLDLYGDLGYKVAIENAYYNWFIDEFGAARIRDKYRAGDPKKVIPFDPRALRFLNLTDQGMTKWMKGFVRGRFCYPCQYEANFVAPPEAMPKWVIDMDDEEEPDTEENTLDDDGSAG